MSAVATNPAPHTASPKPAQKPIEDKGIELKDLRRNAEGIVSVAPREETPEEPLTIVDARQFLGYGGPIAIEDVKGRGLFKALGGDGLYVLSNGGSYVLPKELAQALGNTLPEPSKAEQAAMAGKLDEFEAEERAEAEKDAQTRGKKVETPAHTTPGPTPPTPTHTTPTR